MSKEVGEMVRSRDVVQAEGSARTEGARRATGVRADGAAAGAGSLAPGQRWSASRKRDVVLVAIAARIAEFGFSPNKVAALGENLLLLVNLAWSAWLYARFLQGRGSFAALERWQTTYLPVYAVWAGLVVAVFPPLFGYV